MTGPGGDAGLEAELRRLVVAGIAEDVGDGDWTTTWTVDPGTGASAEVVAKEPLILAGGWAVELTFLHVDPELEVVALVPDGEPVDPGTPVLRIVGSARAILTAERTALNFLARLSGIATLTRRFVERVRGRGARITDTRKTTPGWRHLEKWAVRTGGGANHRMGLHDMILVKDNHVAAAGGLEAAVRRVAECGGGRLPVEVEVFRPAGVEVLRDLPVDRILLDNMSLEELREAVRRVRAWPAPRPELEASGNMTLDRVREVAEAGVDWISVGALTHSARAVDLSLRLRLEAGR